MRFFSLCLSVATKWLKRHVFSLCLYESGGKLVTEWHWKRSQKFSSIVHRIFSESHRDLYVLTIRFVYVDLIQRNWCTKQRKPLAITHTHAQKFVSVWTRKERKNHIFHLNRFCRVQTTTHGPHHKLKYEDSCLDSILVNLFILNVGSYK